MTDETLPAIGRMTVAAGELEGLPACRPGAPDETRPSAVLEPARSGVRGSAQQTALVEAAATRLARARLAVRTLDGITAFLPRVRDDLSRPSLDT